MTEKLRNCRFYGAIIANKIKTMNKICSNQIFRLMTRGKNSCFWIAPLGHTFADKL